MRPGARGLRLRRGGAGADSRGWQGGGDAPDQGAGRQGGDRRQGRGPGRRRAGGPGQAATRPLRGGRHRQGGGDRDPGRACGDGVAGAAAGGLHGKVAALNSWTQHQFDQQRRHLGAVVWSYFDKITGGTAAAWAAKRASSELICTSSASSLARVLASTWVWMSNSSRVTRSSLEKPCVIMDLTFFSMSFAGEFSMAWLILFCKSLKKVFISIIFLDLVGPSLHHGGASRR